jgi:transcriptional regulator with XRE-family HTH domain
MPTGGQQGAPGFDPVRLRAARKAANLTLATVATETGVAPSTVANWERGERVPRTDRLAVLARVTGVRPADLTDETLPGEDSLRELRVAAGLLQRDAAEQAGLTRSWYSWLESGRAATIGPADCAALARVFGVAEIEVRVAHSVGRARFVERALSAGD